MTVNLSYPPASLRREDAAEYLGISPRTLDTFQEKSLIVPINLAGMKRFRRADLDEFVASRADWVAPGDRA